LLGLVRRKIMTAIHNHHECQQCADVDHFSDVVDRRDAANDSGQQTDQNRVFVWRAELWMNRGKDFLGSKPSLAIANRTRVWPTTSPA